MGSGMGKAQSTLNCRIVDRLSPCRLFFESDIKGDLIWMMSNIRVYQPPSLEVLSFDTIQFDSHRRLAESLVIRTH
jgi:hypothetical protein